jgi:hypothetical protein
MYMSWAVKIVPVLSRQQFIAALKAGKPWRRLQAVVARTAGKDG